MISKKTALKALADYHRVKPQEKLLAADTSGGVFWCEVTDGVPVLKCRHGDYEFIGSFGVRDGGFIGLEQLDFARFGAFRRRKLAGT